MNTNEQINALRGILALSQEYHEAVIKIVALRNDAIAQFQAAINDAVIGMDADTRADFHARVWKK